MEKGTTMKRSTRQRCASIAVVALMTLSLGPVDAAATGSGCAPHSCGRPSPPASPKARAELLQPGATTAWRDGQLHVDVAGVVGRSDVVLGRPDIARTDSMPLGNGRLGAAVWAADGMTVQLNRADTFPDRLSPGQLVVPGLERLVNAPDYKGRVDLYDGTFVESGGGMTAMAYIRADKDELVLEVSGSDPARLQNVQVHLWPPRKSLAAAQGSIAVLSDTWKDDTQSSASGRVFGTLVGLTAHARDVRASVIDSRTVTLSFKPERDGRYRIVVAAPHWSGGDAMSRAGSLLAADVKKPQAALRGSHLRWWHRYWHTVGLMKLSSSDGAAQYMENLRAIYLYTAAAQDRSRFPGSNAGVADLFFFNRDTHRWNPADFWQWNLRMQVAANLGAGAFALNGPYFRLYRENLAHLQGWTRQRMGGRAGICIPETMRFNGNGVDYQKTARGTEIFRECDATVPAAWNARTVSTGAEVSLWIWRQYLYTHDRHFLARNYLVMAGAARYLLAYATIGPRGRLHTDPSNAHETQWDVRDPTTDIAAMQALFPAVIEAATRLHRDPSLVRRLQQARAHILPFPRTDAATHTQRLPANADAAAADVIAPSYEPAAKRHNIENIGLEPVWPYELVGSGGIDLALARRTFENRVTPDRPEWSEDAVDAARLGLPDAVRDNLVAITTAHQGFVSGLASLFGSKRSPSFNGKAAPYIEQSANVALALQEALVQVDDGVLEIARAWPKGWTGAGTVFVRGKISVSVQMVGGIPVTVGIQAGADRVQAIGNPWPGQRVRVLAGRRGRHASRTVHSTSSAVFLLPLHRGWSYLIERDDARSSALPFAPVSGTPAARSKTLGPVSIGLSSSAATRAGR